LADKSDELERMNIEYNL